MNSLRQPIIALFVATCLLSVSGLAYSQTVSHSLHHAHHTAATHATVLCSWVCEAGHMAESPAVWLDHFSSLLGWVETQNVHSRPIPHLIHHFSRGPPA